MIEGKNVSKIEEQTENEYRKMVEQNKELYSYDLAKILKLKFEPKTSVAVSVGEIHLEGIIRKGEAGVYIVDVKNRDGTLTPMICTEKALGYWI